MGSVSGVRVALLRGINVGRAKRVPMADLREVFTELGYKDVKTLLNSGNVVFSGPAETTAKSEARIEAAFTARFAFSCRITVLSAAELAEVVKQNPIQDFSNPSRFLVAFLKTAGHREHLLPLVKEKWHPEVFGLGSRAAYLWVPDGVLASRLGAAVNKALGDSVTARNWATVIKLEAQCH